MNGNKQNAAMGAMTEQVIAADFLQSAKTGIKEIATALTVTSTPEVRDTLRRYLNDALDTHEEIAKYMLEKGNAHPNDLAEQLTVDLKAANTALNLQQSQGQQQQQ